MANNLSSNIGNNLIGKLFDMVRDRLMQSQRGRWILSALFLVLGILSAVFAATAPTASQGLGFGIGAALFLSLGLLVLVGNIVIGASQGRLRKVTADSEARAKQLLADGKILPLPPLPQQQPQGISPEDLAFVETNANQLQEIPWGDQVTCPKGQERAAFESAMANVEASSGDWSKLRGPVKVFAGLPRPLCHVGAAEVMYRLSYLRGRLYAPVGLRQGLRFALRAQLHTPQQPDALVVQFKLLSASRAAYWQELATKTLDMLRQVAPDHPRLPKAEMTYREVRGEYDEALVCADRVIALANTPERRGLALGGKATLLMSLKRYDETIPLFREAATLKPGDPWIWHNLSIALTELGRYQEALDCNERALSIMDFGVARNQREILVRKLAEQQGNAQ